MSLPSESSQMPVASPPQLATTEGSQGNQVPSKARDESIDSSSHAQTCCKKGCQLPAHSLQRCTAIFIFGCKKSIHVECHKEIEDKYMLENLVGMDGITQMVACTKLCHTKVAKELKKTALMNQNKNNNCIPWEKDGAGGENDPSNLMNILLEWMTMDGGKKLQTISRKK
jgi:hypothetical protein